MSFQRFLGACALSGAIIAISIHGVSAQGFLRPPGSVPGGEAGVVQVQAQDSATLLIRIDRLENQVRGLNGQIEQMQFQMRKLDEQLRKFQQDVDFRFQENSGKPAPRPQPQTTPQRRGDLNDAPPPGGSTLASNPSVQPIGRAARRGDAFDPDADPAAPGAPRQLGSIRSGATALPPPSTGNTVIDEDDSELDGDAPLDLNPRGQRPAPLGPRPALNRSQTAAVDPTLPPSLPRVLPPLPQSQQALPPTGSVVAALPPAGSGPKADYDAALITFKAGQYEDSQNGLQDFVKKYPKDRLVSEAVFYLGESYAKRGRHREAAEQYLKVSTDYSKSGRAPEAMVKLGLSLEKLGLKEQACATFGEVGRKFPNASASLRTTADREFKRGQC